MHKVNQIKISDKNKMNKTASNLNAESTKPRIKRIITQKRNQIRRSNSETCAKFRSRKTPEFPSQELSESDWVNLYLPLSDFHLYLFTIIRLSSLQIIILLNFKVERLPTRALALAKPFRWADDLKVFFQHYDVFLQVLCWSAWCLLQVQAQGM